MVVYSRPQIPARLRSLWARVADGFPHIYNIQQAVHKVTVWIVGEKQIPCFPDQRGFGLGKAVRAKSQAIAAQISIWTCRRIFPDVGRAMSHMMCERNFSNIRRALSQAIASRIGTWMEGWNKCIQFLYIPLARMRAGIYYRLLTRPAAILVGFRARSRAVIRGAAFAALVYPA